MAETIIHLKYIEENRLLRAELHWSGMPKPVIVLATLKEIDHFPELDRKFREFSKELAAAFLKEITGIQPVVKDLLEVGGTSRN